MTKNLQNNPAGLSGDPLLSKSLSKNTFHKRERLRSRKAFDFLFSKGKSFTEGSIRVVWTISLPSELNLFPTMIAFAIPKKNIRKAVSRNKIRRRMRESYRRNRQELLGKCKEKNIFLAFVLIHSKPGIPEFGTIDLSVKNILNKLLQKI